MVAGVDYGQLVIGPPGSGKTTYCEGVHQILSQLRRPHLLINLDFANDWRAKIDYADTKKQGEVVSFDPPDVDVRELVTVTQIMEERDLGPNGALIFCNRLLASNIEWLTKRIKDAKKNKSYDHAYLLFDLPGQVELYTHDDSIQTIIKGLSNKGRSMQLAAVHLIDSTLCVAPHQYISGLLISLSAQIALELPFINVFSKMDLLDDHRRHLHFPLEFYARAEDLSYLVPYAHPPSIANSRYGDKETKFEQFHRAVCDLVEDFNLVSFLPLNIQDKESTLAVLAAVDQANGYALSAYLPPHLRFPGQEGPRELRLDCVNPALKAFGSLWFDSFDNAVPKTVTDGNAVNETKTS